MGFGSTSSGSRFGLTRCGVMRPPRASRAYPSTAKLILISASASDLASADSFVDFGKAIVGGPQAVFVGLADLLDHRFGAVVEPILIDPEEAVLGHGIIFDEGPLLGLPRLAGIGEFGRELFLNGGADRLGAADQGVRETQVRRRRPAAPAARSRTRQTRYGK